MNTVHLSMHNRAVCGARVLDPDYLTRNLSKVDCNDCIYSKAWNDAVAQNKAKNTEDARPLACGDVVIFKSGGPLMTVADVFENPVRFACQWFDEKQEAHSHIFSPAVLVKQG